MFGKPEGFLSKKEQKKRKRAIEKANRATSTDLEEKMRVEQARVAKRALNIWNYVKRATPDHPYLKRKQVTPYGLRVDDRNRLIVPLVNEEGGISSVQYIYPNGRKQYLKEGEKSGRFFSLQSVSEDATKFILVEGVATGLSVFSALEGRITVIVCCDAGNIEPVGKVIRRKYPNAEILIAADDDKYAADNDKHKETNTGLDKAKEAAVVIGGRVVAPVFKDETTLPADFNDLLVLEGAEEVRQQISQAFSKDNLNITEKDIRIEVVLNVSNGS